MQNVTARCVRQQLPDGSGGGGGPESYRDWSHLREPPGGREATEAATPHRRWAGPHNPRCMTLARRFGMHVPQEWAPAAPLGQVTAGGSTETSCSRTEPGT